jgi:predicted flap endonuclease-1-like 5' DNA nuclease
LRWFKADGGKTGSPVVIELDPESFNALLASGASPSDAASAEIHIFIPPQTSQEIENISLGFPTRTIIPVSFVAKSPGQLTVSSWQVGFESEPGIRPSIPPRGLCTPTPPGSRPGETSDDNCFCKSCKSHQSVAEVEMMETESGTFAMVGRCASCGDDMIRFGGRSVAGAAMLPVRRIVTPQPILIITTSVEPAPAPIEPSPAPIAQAELQPTIQPVPAELTPITVIKGIGERIAEQLAGLGITSLETLAAASPEQIAQVKSITEAQAARFIEQAQTLTGSDK